MLECAEEHLSPTILLVFSLNWYTLEKSITAAMIFAFAALVKPSQM
jgi:hypothetical protein